MEKFVATIGRRWTFMEHMELPAYRDGLLETADEERSQHSQLPDDYEAS